MSHLLARPCLLPVPTPLNTMVQERRMPPLSESMIPPWPSHTLILVLVAIQETGLAASRYLMFQKQTAQSCKGVRTVTYYDGAATAAFEERVHTNSLILLDSDTLAVAYRGADAHGFIRTYDITSTGLTATSEPFGHDTEVGAFNSLVRIDDLTFALVYGGDLPRLEATETLGIPNRIKTLAAVVTSSDTTLPIIESASVLDENTILLVASEFLDGTVNAGNFAVANNPVSGVPVIYGRTITITVDMPLANGDTITVGYRGTTITDVAGNALAIFDDLLVPNTLSGLPPTVTITAIGIPDNGATDSATVSYTAVFSEAVTGFGVEASDITLSGTADATVSRPVVTGDTYAFTVTAITDGTVGVTIPAGAAEDADGNGNTASATYTVTLDIIVQIGTYVSTIGSSGMGDGEFNDPIGITTNSTHILVVDSQQQQGAGI